MTDHPTRFVGVDYHERELQVCVMDASGHRLRQRRCPNRAPAILDAVEAETAAPAAHVAIEASTGAADLAETLSEAGCAVALAHPLYVERLRQSPDKTDLSDAALLADLLRVGYLPRSYRPTGWERELRRLVRHRQSLADQRRAIKQRIGALVRDHRLGEGPGSRWSRAWRQWVRDHPELGAASRWLIAEWFDQLEDCQRRIERAEAELQRMTETDALTQRLLSEPGIGLIIATLLRAEVGRFDRFRSGKALARFCGLSPANASSGSTQRDRGLIHTADHRLRAALIQAAWGLTRRSPRFSALAASMQRRGKPKALIVAAVANRFMRGLFHRMQPRA